MSFTIPSTTSFLLCQHSTEYFKYLTKCPNLYQNLFQEMHHLVKWQCFEVLAGLVSITSKEAYHESDGQSSMFWEQTPLRIAFTELGLRSKRQTWFCQKCPLLSDKDRFHFVYAKYGSGYMSEVCHFVTQEVTTAKSVQTPPLHKNYKSYADLGSTTWKNSSKK